MSAEKKTLISVIVPIYNVELYLNKCINSIVQQSYQNLEIILVNDGSSDHCGEICDRWALNDPRIKVFHKINEGLSSARNLGIEKAQGEYFCFIDSDDYIESDMILKLYEAIIKSSAPIAICNYIYEFEQNMENHIQITPDSYQIESEAVVSCQELLKLMSEGKYTFGEVAWNKLYKKNLFDSIRYPVGRIHEDEFIFHRLIYQSQYLVCIPYVGYHYLQRKNSIMHSKKNYYDVLDALIDRCKFFIEKNEKEMTIESEKRLLGIVKNAKKAGIIKKDDLQLRTYLSIIWQIYHKHWFPLSTLCKRIIRFYILYKIIKFF